MNPPNSFARLSRPVSPVGLAAVDPLFPSAPSVPSVPPDPQAAGFYERMGFRTAGRDATDPSGRPYPILHMELGHAPHTGLVPIPSLLTDRIDIGFRAEVSDTDTEKQP